MRNILILLLLIIGGFAVYSLITNYTATENQQENTNNLQTEQNSSNTENRATLNNNQDGIGNVETWSGYQFSDAEAQYQFTLKYPPQTEASREGGGVNFVYAGEDNRPPALTDGFSTFIRFEDRQDVSVFESEAIGDISETTQGNNTMYYFQTQTDFSSIPIDNYVIYLDDTTQISISHTYVGSSEDIKQYITANGYLRKTMVINEIN